MYQLKHNRVRATKKSLIIFTSHKCFFGSDGVFSWRLVIELGLKMLRINDLPAIYCVLQSSGRKAAVRWTFWRGFSKQKPVYVAHRRWLSVYWSCRSPTDNTETHWMSWNQMTKTSERIQLLDQVLDNLEIIKALFIYYFIGACGWRFWSIPFVLSPFSFHSFYLSCSGKTLVSIFVVGTCIYPPPYVFFWP